MTRLEDQVLALAGVVQAARLVDQVSRTGSYPEEFLAPLINSLFVFEPGEAAEEDARPLLDYVHAISGESDFLSFGPGEFEMTELQEEAFIRECREAANRLFIVGLIGPAIIASLTFLGGGRPRVSHCGEMGMTVRKQYWGLGIGRRMLDALLNWAKGTHVVTKINLRVRTDNPRAIRLYEQCGFVREGTIRKEIYLAGRYFDHHWMGLEL